MSASNKPLEHELVLRLQNREVNALSYLYDAYSEALYGTALNILKSQQLAEEVTQDLFVKVWENIHKYDPKKGRLFTWMINILRNLSIDKLRSRDYKLSEKSDPVGSNVYKEGVGQTVEQAVDGLGLEVVLEGMDDDQRLIIELTYFKGYTQSEIAREYDIPLGTVKTRLRIGMLYLRKKLGVI